MEISTNYVAVLGFLVATVTFGNAITKALGFIYSNARIREAGDALSLVVAGIITMTADHVAITRGANNLAHPEHALLYGAGWVTLIVVGSLIAARAFPGADGQRESGAPELTPTRTADAGQRSPRRPGRLVSFILGAITTTIVCAICGALRRKRR